MFQVLHAAYMNTVAHVLFYIPFDPEADVSILYNHECLL